MGTARNLSKLLNPSGALADFQGQLIFPATQNPSSNANTLDDYEEGTWTPVFRNVTGMNYTNQFGRYTKVGRIVHFNIFLLWSGSSPSGSSVLVSLPFVISSGLQFIGACSYTANNLSLPSGVYEISLQLDNASDSLTVFGQRSGNTKLTFPPANLSSAGEFVASGHFETT